MKNNEEIKKILKGLKFFFWCFIAIIFIFIDLFTKSRMIDKNIIIIPGVLNFRYVNNEGAAFGIGSNSEEFEIVMIVICVAIIIGLISYMLYAKPKNMIPYVLVLSGAIPNCMERAIVGYVVDFIDLEFINFPVFNIADILICVGIFWIVIDIIRNMVKKDKIMKIVLATNNEHKIKEFKEILKDKEILSLKDIEFNQEIDENGKTFEENSLIKAKTIHDYLKSQGKDYIVIADDSGLCVDSLGGEPGIYSARYAGKHGDDQANRDKLQEELKGKDRKAYFNCTIVVYYPDESYKVFEGRTYGTITEEELGSKEFGYDCIFKSDDLNKTFGEATEEEKNAVSHRGRAIEKMIKEL